MAWRVPLRLSGRVGPVITCLLGLACAPPDSTNDGGERSGARELGVPDLARLADVRMPDAEATGVLGEVIGVFGLADDSIIVLNAHEPFLALFDTAGRLLWSGARRGAAPNELSRPGHAALVGGG